MAVINWIKGMFGSGSTGTLETWCGGVVPEIFFKELAINTCINLISNAISKSEFITYDEGKEVRKENYYLFNVEPNQNQSASKFWRDVVYKLIYENECLVIQNNDKFYVADSFTTTKYAFLENTYKDIVVSDYKVHKAYKESEVFHFELHNQKIKDLLEGLYNLYGDLLAYSKKNYKRSNAKRGTLEVPGSYNQTKQGQQDLEDLLNQRFKTYFEAEGGAVLPLTNGFKYTEHSSNGYKTGSDSRDIRALIDDIFDFVAIAFQISPQLLKGSVADTAKAVSDLLTFCVNPIVELFADEINRKHYGKQAFLERSYLRIDTSMVKASDLKDIAGSLDILFRVGANTINDNLKLLGREPINEEWANTRFITKNYQSVRELKGGEKNEGTKN